jgi:hypothetical protein
MPIAAPPREKVPREDAPKRGAIAIVDGQVDFLAI